MSGFIPTRKVEAMMMMAHAYKAHQEGGKSGLGQWLIMESTDGPVTKGTVGNRQLIDLPFVSFDDDYTIREAANDYSSAVDFGSTLFADIITEIFALFGATFGTLVNFATLEIDDLAKPPITLPDTTGIFLPSYIDRSAYTNETLIDAPMLFISMPPTLAVFGDRMSLFGGLLAPSIMGLPNSVSAGKPVLFRWSGGSRSGVWS